MSVFPLEGLIPGVPVSGVERFGSFFMLNDPGMAVSGPIVRRSRKPVGGGRPRKYPWDEFFLEVAALVERHELPEKKEAAIEYFQKWFADRTQELPSRTMVGQKLTPYYQRFVRDAGRKISRGIPV